MFMYPKVFPVWHNFCFGAVSRSVIIATSVAGLLLVGVILLLLTITGCIKIIVKIKSSIPKKKKE